MSMTRKKIEDSIKEARRFIVAAQGAIERLDAENLQRDERYDEMAQRGYTERVTPGPRPGDYSYGSSETGALRRHSMDLTRKLAELRKP